MSIENYYAWVAVQDDQEGLIVAPVPGIPLPVPLINRNHETILKQRQIAIAYGRARGLPVRLVRFLRAETLEEIAPSAADATPTRR